jgi:hypothetical protein
METIQAIQVSTNHLQVKQVGGRVFWVAAAIQFLAMVLLVAGFYFYQYQRFRQIEEAMRGMQLETQDRQDSTSSSLEEGTVYFEIHFWYWMALPFGTAFFAAGFPFCLGAWLSGRNASRRISQKQVPYAGAGIFAMLGPSLAAAITLFGIENILSQRTWENINNRLWDEGIIVFLGYTAMFLLPAVVTGILAGFVTRQKLAAIQFKAIQGNVN